MGAREKLTIIVDMVADKATASVKKLDAQLVATGKTTDGLKGSMNRASQWLSNNWQTAALAAGTAAVTFGAKSVKAFQDTALGAAKMADATGLAVDEASRWREVASDLGVSSDSLTSALNKMNREAASGGLAKVGIDAQGTNNQLLAVLGYLNGITDANKRAAEGTRLLGRGWQELAPLVTKAGELRDRLAEVSDAKVIDADERKKAEQLRDSLDSLRDSGEDLALTLGEELVPSVTQLAQALADAANSAAGNELIGALSTLVETAAGIASLGLVAEDTSNDVMKFGDTVAGTTRVVFHLNDAMAALQEWNRSGDIGSAGLERLVNKAGGATQAAENARQALSYMGQSAHLADAPVAELADSTDGLADAQRNAARAADEHYNALSRVADSAIAAEDAGLAYSDALASLAVAQAEAADKGGKNAEANRAVDDATRSARDAAIKNAEALAAQAGASEVAAGRTWTTKQANDNATQSLLYMASTANGPLKQAILQHVARLNGIPDNVASDLIARDMASGTIAAVNGALNRLDGRTVRVHIVADQRGMPGQAFASGGTLGAGKIGVAGETNEPEIVQTPRSTFITSGPTLLRGPAKITGVRDTARLLAGGGAASVGGGGQPIVVNVLLDGKQVGQAMVRADRAMS